LVVNGFVVYKGLGFFRLDYWSGFRFWKLWMADFMVFCSRLLFHGCLYGVVCKLLGWLGFRAGYIDWLGRAA
jgi:hypothetical protein